MLTQNYQAIISDNPLNVSVIVRVQKGASTKCNNNKYIRYACTEIIRAENLHFIKKIRVLNVLLNVRHLSCRYRKKTTKPQIVQSLDIIQTT